MQTVHMDGRAGEGGGQILRSSLSLAVLTGQRLVIDGIRAGRAKPGLMRQHKAAVAAAATICGAEVVGDDLGSTHLEFTPGQVRGGEYTFSIATAGSACLVLQTILPPLLHAAEPSTLVLEGGTHNPMAPPFDFLVQSFFPVLERMGAKVSATIESYGFYPAGGGRFVVRIEPVAKLLPYELVTRGPIVKRSVRIASAHMPANVMRREVEHLQEALGWPEESFTLDTVPSPGPGNAVLVSLQSAEVTELVTGFAEKGVSVQKVLEPVIHSVRDYLSSAAPVGEYLADQLILPMAMAGSGAFACVGLSRHTTTNIDVVQRFLPVQITTQKEQDSYLVRFSRR